ncbi:hypothetical protein [Dyadobacter sp. NIV53]|uniref:hypothetical protein n=1 Tax=Dyadobacter sp. NIV53 TaxID=2861765 RepID=UPI001C87014B|nr:hypothetical protein [Dyadobacter sp. NIV53]
MSNQMNNLKGKNLTLPKAPFFPVFDFSKKKQEKNDKEPAKSKRGSNEDYRRDGTDTPKPPVKDKPGR